MHGAQVTTDSIPPPPPPPLLLHDRIFRRSLEIATYDKFELEINERERNVVWGRGKRGLIKRGE